MVLKSQLEENNTDDGDSLERPRTIDYIPNETDSEVDENDQDVDSSGYVLLPQSLEASVSDSEEEFPQIGSGGYMIDLSQPPHEWIPSEAELKSTETRELKLDDEKIEKIKSAMACFTLPSTAQPTWASEITDEQWEQRLQQILRRKDQ